MGKLFNLSEAQMSGLLQMRNSNSHREHFYKAFRPEQTCSRCCIDSGLSLGGIAPPVMDRTRKQRGLNRRRWRTDSKNVIVSLREDHQLFKRSSTFFCLLSPEMSFSYESIEMWIGARTDRHLVRMLDLGPWPRSVPWPGSSWPLPKRLQREIHDRSHWLDNEHGSWSRRSVPQCWAVLQWRTPLALVR